MVRRKISPDARLGLVISLPFLAFVSLFLIYPVVVVMIASVTGDGGFTTDSLQKALQGTYGKGFANSIILAVTTAVIGGVLGLLLALSVKGLERPRWIHNTVNSWSAVA
ncbi:MAG: hypothetical protein K9G05_06190, partial [Candidatus Nanopelagicales bacterium]|nr:hypothetical protein [Candidatus Nanopelagicales bacterium]